MKNNKIQQIQVTIQDIWAASRSTIQRNKKKYNRKTKHKNSDKFGD